MGLQKHISNWARLSRVPFHLVGIAPILVGTLWAGTKGFDINWTLAILAIIAVVLTMLSTYLGGEYYDQKEDYLSVKYGKSNFAGGSQVIQEGLVEQNSVKLASIISAIFVIIIGLYIYFGFDTGPWTIPLGAFGLAAGFFYSTPPFRFVKRGVGEILIGLCYGYLPVFVASYLQTNYLEYNLVWISKPIAISIFMVIFINEFPDYPGDQETGKRNLVVRLGLFKSSIVYIISQAFFIVSIVLLVQHLNYNILWFLAPIIISLTTIFMTAFKLYQNKKALEVICGLTIVLNLATNLILIIILW